MKALPIFVQQGKEDIAVQVFREEGLSIVPTIEDVVNCLVSPQIMASAAWHGELRLKSHGEGVRREAQPSEDNGKKAQSKENRDLKKTWPQTS